MEQNSSSGSEFRKANSCFEQYNDTSSYIQAPEGSQSMALAQNTIDMTKQQSNGESINSRISQHQLALSKLQINPIDDEQSIITPLGLETEQDLTPIPNKESPNFNEYTKASLKNKGQRASLALTESVRKEHDVENIDDQSESYYDDTVTMSE